MRDGSEVAKLVEGILAGVKASGSKELDSWRNPKRDIHNLARKDYAPGMRKLLDETDLENIIRSARNIFPAFNREHDPVRVERWLNSPEAGGLEGIVFGSNQPSRYTFSRNPIHRPRRIGAARFFRESRRRVA